MCSLLQGLALAAFAEETLQASPQTRLAIHHSSSQLAAARYWTQQCVTRI